MSLLSGTSPAPPVVARSPRDPPSCRRCSRRCTRRRAWPSPATTPSERPLRRIVILPPFESSPSLMSSRRHLVSSATALFGIARTRSTEPTRLDGADDAARRSIPIACVSRSSTIASSMMRDPRHHAARRSRAVRSYTTSNPSAGTADQPGDDHDRERHHDRLVHAEQDRGPRERQLHLPEQSADGVDPYASRRFDDLLRHLADPQVGQPDRPAAARRSPTAITPGTRPELEQEDHRHQVDERRHRLHRVEHRLERPAGTDRSAPTRPRAGSRSRSTATTATSTWLSVSIARSHMPEHADRQRRSRPQSTARLHATGDPPREQRGAADDHPPRLADQQVPQRVQRELDQSRSLIAVRDPAERALDPDERVVRRRGDRDGQAVGKSCWRSTSRPMNTATADERRTSG